MTEKGERRRRELVAAATALLRAGGFDAVRHRTVAEHAGLPLASTTYYVASLDELVAAAVERTGREELAAGHAQLAALADRPAEVTRSSRSCSTSCSGRSRTRAASTPCRCATSA